MPFYNTYWLFVYKPWDSFPDHRYHFLMHGYQFRLNSKTYRNETKNFATWVRCVSKCDNSQSKLMWPSLGVGRNHCSGVPSLCKYIVPCRFSDFKKKSLSYNLFKNTRVWNSKLLKLQTIAKKKKNSFSTLVWLFFGRKL